ncbi:uroporphyrinogen-III synthase [Lysobacter humi (ex Lee et al. 2017)]
MHESLSTGPRWYVISLRPRGGHAALREAARRRGHGFLALSVSRIVARGDATARAALADALAAEVVVFTSPAAVRAAASLQPLDAVPQALAIGAGTARALRRAGVARVLHPARMDSDGLLALPVLDDVDGRAVGLVTAPGGRDAIAPSLVARGARVRRADVYERAPCAPPATALRQLDALGARAAIALSSGEALDALLACMEPPRAQALRRARIVAASDRLAALAQARGFVDVVRAAGPRPAQLVAAVAG